MILYYEILEKYQNQAKIILEKRQNNGKNTLEKCQNWLENTLEKCQNISQNILEKRHLRLERNDLWRCYAEFWRKDAEKKN